MGVDGSECWMKLKFEVEVGWNVEKSHDGKKPRGHHRKSTSSIHGSDLVYLLSLATNSYLPLPVLKQSTGAMLYPLQY